MHSTREFSFRKFKLAQQDMASAFNGCDNTPKEAITMGIATIPWAKEIALIATGSHKAVIVHRLLNTPSSQEVPASYLRKHNRTTVYLDESAVKTSMKSNSSQL
ncbi:MAG: 6-phosphogluconolactonase [Deltaproteobacteria bacterium]|nr:6-phosphogluconolactonase [Deltaproteobacteria bacterium]